MRPGKHAGQDKTRRSHELIDELERLNASIHAKVEHPSRVITRQFKHVKVRDRGLKKNTAQLSLLVALSNLWMLRTTLQVLDGQIRAQPAKAAGESGRNGLRPVRTATPHAGSALGTTESAHRDHYATGCTLAVHLCRPYPAFRDSKLLSLDGTNEGSRNRAQPTHRPASVQYKVGIQRIGLTVAIITNIATSAEMSERPSR